MSSILSRCSGSDPREWLGTVLASCGVWRWGVAQCAPVGANDSRIFDRWTAAGYHGGMAYLEKYSAVRRDPALLLEGATRIIVCLFPYYYPLPGSAAGPRFARYALGDDYHDVVRSRLSVAASAIEEKFGCATRVCVDTAPLRERYWAVMAGTGFIGRNCQLIVPGAGSYFFIGSILASTDIFSPDQPCHLTCGSCGRCLRECPSGALRNPLPYTPATLDARRCLSYLTIEHRGPLPDGVRLGGRVYGCDVCADVCPHNANPPVTTIPEFIPRPEILGLTLDDILSMSREDFSRIFRRSAIKRTRLDGLQRNALRLRQEAGNNQQSEKGIRDEHLGLSTCFNNT